MAYYYGFVEYVLVFVKDNGLSIFQIFMIVFENKTLREYLIALQHNIPYQYSKE
ncbi:hypothetical protein ACJX0J_040176, partial [Zea mays]